MKWTIFPERPHLGLVVRAGKNGAVLPVSPGSLKVGAQELSGPKAYARYPLSTQPVTLNPTMRDLAAVAPRDQDVRLYVTLYHADGLTSTSRAYFVSTDGPEGLVYAYITREGTYYTSEGLPDDPSIMLEVHCENGTVYRVQNPGSGLSLADSQQAYPARVYAVTADGLTSEDLLAGVEAERLDGGAATRFSAWPLPPYLDASRPNLAAVLRAFEHALDLHPDEAGDYLSAEKSTGRPLTYMAGHYGITRQDSPTDAAMIRRILATLTPFKSSRPGLEAMLRAYGIFGGRVEDFQSLGGTPLVWDGSWEMDGGTHFNGGTAAYGTTLGDVVALFRREPVRGFGRALEVLRRYKAAGVRTRVRLAHQGYGDLTPIGTRAYRRIQAPMPQFRVDLHNMVGRLSWDGSWLMDGSEVFDGIR